MTAPSDLEVRDALNVISSKQDRLETRLDEWQATIIEHFNSLSQPFEGALLRPGLPTVRESIESVIRTPRSMKASNFSIAMATPSIEKKTQFETDYPQWKSGKSVSSNSNDAGSFALTSSAPIDKTSSIQAAISRLPRTCTPFNYGGESEPPKAWRAFTRNEAKRLQNASKSEGFFPPRATMMTTPLKPSSSTFTEIAEGAHRCSAFLIRFFRRAMFDSINPKDSCLVNLVRHPLFDFVCGAMVLGNSLLVGITVENEATSGNARGILEPLGHACGIFFILELCLRMTAFGVRAFFFYHEDRMMNIFDTLIVMMTIVDTVMFFITQGKTLEVGQAFKTLKVLRVVRIFRTFRFFRELRLMVMMIAECLTSLFWAIVLLMIIMYTFAVIFTQSAATYRSREQVNLRVHSKVEEMFGTMARTCYYLFQSMLGGISWGEVSDMLMEVDSMSVFFFFFYITFTMLAVLNIITGIFVDNALETSRVQRDYIIKREEKARAQSMKELAKIFDGMDEDESGTISWEEMEAALEHPDTANYFAAIGLRVNYMKQLFTLMDEDGSGQVPMEEFLESCSRFSGDAKSVDIHAILHEIRRLNKKLEDRWATVVSPTKATTMQNGHNNLHAKTFYEDVQI